MGFDNSSNRARARKMAEGLDLMAKSVASNKATTREVADVLQPAFAALKALGFTVIWSDVASAESRAATLAALDHSRAARALGKLQGGDTEEAARLLKLAVRGHTGAAE